jgi:methyl-accepting chemotaxis protein
MDPDDREFMRQLLLRHEKATDAMIARLDKGTEESARRTEEIRARTEEIRARTEEIRAGMYDLSDAIRAHTREFVAEMRAQRDALFRVLDRLDGQGA